MSLGAFAGGLANGISQGIRNTHAWNKIEQEKADMEKEQAWKKETEGLYNKFAGVAENSADTIGQVADSQSSPSPLQNAGQVATVPQPTAAQSGDTSAPVQSAGQQKPLGNLADAMNFATEQTKINMKYGKASPMDLVQLKRMSDTFEREGLDAAIGMLAGGDYEGALKAYNATGKDNGVTFKGTPQQGVFEFAGQKVPTVIATVVGSDGSERQINTAQVMAAKMGLDKQLSTMMDSLKLNATIDHQNQSVGLQRDQLNEQRRHNIASEGLMGGERYRAAGTGGGKGKWVQDETGEWQFINTGDTAQGSVKEQVNINDVGTVTAYDPVTGTARTVYTPEQAETIARSRAEAESQKAGRGIFSLEWNEDKIQSRAEEIKAQLLNQSVRPQRNGGVNQAGPSSGIGGSVNNNVGGMRPEGKSTGFQSFSSMEDSIKAIDSNLKAYGEKHGIDTLEGVISRWSPNNENDTQALIANASRATGIKPGQKIDLGNPAVRAVISAAIIRQEGSSAYLDGIRGGVSQKGAGKSVSPSSVVRNGIKSGSGEKPWYEKDVDVGAVVGKPMAAMGESVGKSVANTVNALAAIKNTLTEAEYQKALAYAQAQNVDIGPMIKQLGADGFKAWLASANPAKNTEQYMQRTSSNNLNQYFR